MADDQLESLSRQFEFFAKEECCNSSVLYGRLSLSIANDTRLLGLAARGRIGERVPNLFFAAVHFLLLKGIAHPVARFYESLSSLAEKHEDPFPGFRSFCLEYENEISRLISARTVQTNEVRRCACLLPIFVAISRESHNESLFIIEIGAAAGLLLLWDHYGYKYGSTLKSGNAESLVQIECGLRGEGLPPIAEVLPEVSGRLGIDLNPLDVRNHDAGLWLRALIWPEHEKRARLLAHAVAVAQRNPPPLVAGDAVEVLANILPSIPLNTVLCIIRVWTSLSLEAREQLSLLMAQYGRKRDLFVVSTVSQRSSEIGLQLTSFINGVKSVRVLARCETHGEWLQWLS